MQISGPEFNLNNSMKSIRDHKNNWKAFVCLNALKLILKSIHTIYIHLITKFLINKLYYTYISNFISSKWIHEQLQVFKFKVRMISQYKIMEKPNQLLFRMFLKPSLRAAKNINNQSIYQITYSG